MQRAGVNILWTKEVVNGLRTAAEVDFTVGEEEVSKLIDALRAEERFHHGVGGGFAAAINQPIVAPARRLHKDGVAAIERENGQAGGGTFPQPVSPPDGGAQYDGADFPPPMVPEQPAGQRAEQDEIIQAD